MAGTISRRGSLPPILNIELPLPSDTDFSLANIPFGVFSPPPNVNRVFRTHRRQKHICTAIGEYILDLYILTLNNVFATIIPGPVKASGNHPLLQPTLNSFASLGNRASCAVRAWIGKLVQAGGLPSSTEPDAPRMWPPNALWRANTPGIELHLPFDIGNITNFCASREYAARHNVLFSGRDRLHSNYLRLPIGRHGQASSVVITGTPINRPHGQIPRGSRLTPRFGLTEKLDYEIHLSAFIGVPSNMGHPVHVDQAMDHVFGFVLMNDWSARDIEGWECEPLGPFTGKNFGTTISPWVVTPDAIHPFLIPRETQLKETVDNLPGGLQTDSKSMTFLSYLNESRKRTIYDFRIECHVNPPRDEEGNVDWSQPAVITTPKHLIWSFPQMLAQQTVSGCGLKTGDVISSGAISGPGTNEKATLLERNGGVHRKVVDVGWGKSRTWLEDKDEIVIRAWRPLSTRSKDKFEKSRDKGFQTGTRLGTDAISETHSRRISGMNEAIGELDQDKDENVREPPDPIAAEITHPDWDWEWLSAIAPRAIRPSSEAVSPLSGNRKGFDGGKTPKEDQRGVSISNLDFGGLRRRNRPIIRDMCGLTSSVDTFPLGAALIATAALIAGVELPAVAAVLPKSYHLNRGLVSGSGPWQSPGRGRLSVCHGQETIKHESGENGLEKEEALDGRVGFGICSGVVWPAINWKQSFGK